MKKILATIFFVSMLNLAGAQQFTIKSIELTAEQVILHYDLIDTTLHRTYTVYLYSSRDNFLAPLTKVGGDVTGTSTIEVRPGVNRKIIWNSKEELGTSFDGNLELEIRGRAFVPFLRFDASDVRVRKRNVPFMVKWSGGSRQNIINFQLYRNQKLVHSFPNVPNESETKLTIPSSVKPGKGYYFRVSDAKNSDQVVVTSPFTIKRKIPLLLKIVPVIAVGAAASLVAGQESTVTPEVQGPPGVPPAKN